MCGIAGLWDRRGLDATDLTRRVRAMTDAIAYRGPDGSGVWIDAAAGVGLGHRRLAVQDLSDTGAQPMHSASGRFTITYNGEIYNVAELRQTLIAEGCNFRGTSDTEVFLAGLERWGLDTTLAKSAGMFAIALWDREKRSLQLIRDRIGKKPLYFSTAHAVVRFGSELKALLADDPSLADTDSRALASFFRFGYVPEPHSIFKDVRKVAPGTCVEISADGRETTTRYWNLTRIATDGTRAPFDSSYDEICRRAEETISIAVGERLVSDVPLGAFLSGGIDSSLVVALMQKHLSTKVRTFSIGFADERFNEAPFAEKIAAHLGTQHTSFQVSHQDALDVIPKLPEMYDEPFADSSQIVTHLISACARNDVTVALTGDGGDEVAAGYRRHYMLAKWWPTIARIPRPARQLASALLDSIPAQTLDRAVSALGGQSVPSNRIDKLQKLGQLLPKKDVGDVYAGLVSLWPDSETLTPGVTPYPSVVDDNYPDLGSMADETRLLDMLTYLPGDILCKVDRASMAVALETRSPLLDHRVIEFFWRVPSHHLVGADGGKRVLKSILAKHVPAQLFDRPKTGFAVPLADWLRGPLRDWAFDLVRSQRGDAGIDMPRIERALNEHMSGRRNHQHRLWAVLMYLSWQTRWNGSA